MTHDSQNQNHVSIKSYSTARRPFLRSIAGIGVLGTVGLPTLAGRARAASPGMTIDYNRCHVAFVANATAIESLAVYYADREGTRRAAYGIDPTVTNPRGYEPLVIEYDSDEDRSQVQLAEPKASLVHIVAESATARTAVTNPTDTCVPRGFNSAPTAAFTASADDSSATSGETLEVSVDESVTFTSTATDPDLPVERLRYEWDLDGDGTYETTGKSVATTYQTAGEWTVSHRVIDDFDESSVATMGLTVTTAAATYPSTQQAKLLASDGESNDWFGWSVAVAGDTAVIGVRNYVENNAIVGAAYVFTRSQSTWSQQAKLTASDGENGDNFGASVAVAEDTAIIGAPHEDEKGFRAGAAYVFTRGQSTWSQQAKLTAGDGELGDQFGTSVAMADDTAIIGALEEDEKGGNAGAAYVFTRNQSTWSQQAKLTASDGESFDWFGTSVALAGDTALVGAFGEDEKGTNAGAAYVFTRNQSTWSQQAKLTAGDGESGDWFGLSVAMADDTAIIGAPVEDEKGFSAGAAYVFTRSQSTWSQQAKLTASDGESFDTFGTSVALAGDTALVGAFGEDEKGNSAGAAYVFSRSGGTWSQQAKLLASDGENGDWFGRSVAVAGDTALVSALFEDENGSDAGAAYVFV